MAFLVQPRSSSMVLGQHFSINPNTNRILGQVLECHPRDLLVLRDYASCQHNISLLRYESYGHMKSLLEKFMSGMCVLK